MSAFTDGNSRADRRLEERASMHRATGFADGVRRREQSAISLRRAKRRGLLSSKRLRRSSQSDISKKQGAYFEQCAKTEDSVREELKGSLVVLSTHSAAANQTLALKKIRILLSDPDALTPPIGIVVGLGIVPVLIRCLTSSSEEQRLEATWSLSNIATGTHDEAATILPAIPRFISFLTGAEPALREQSLWAIGNLAGDGPEFRAMLHQMGALKPVVDVFTSTKSLSTATTAAWTLTNLAKGRETLARPFVIAGVIRPLLSRLSSEPSSDSSLHSNSPEAVSSHRGLRLESAWLLAHLSAKEVDVVLDMLSLNGDCIGKLCAQLDASDEELSVPVLRSLGNIFASEGVPPQHLDVALASPSLVPALLCFMGASNGSFSIPTCHRSLTKESIWIVGNILSGTEVQKDLAQARGLIAALCALLPNTPFDLQKGATIALFNAVADIHPRRTSSVFSSHSVIATIVSLLTKPDEECVWYALRCVEIACICGYATSIEAEGGMGVLESMQYRETPNTDFWQIALKVLNEHFYNDEDEEGMYGDQVFPDNENPFAAGFSMGTHQQNADVEVSGRGLMQDSANSSSASFGRGRGMVIPAWMQQQQLLGRDNNNR